MSQTPAVDPLSPDADLELRPAPDIPLTGLAAAAVMMAMVIACSLALKLGNAVKLLVAALHLGNVTFGDGDEAATAMCSERGPFICYARHQDPAGHL